MKLLSYMISRLGLEEEMREIYLHRFIYQMSKKFVAIFIPLYILDLGFSPLIVIAFFMAYFTFSMFTALPGGLLASKIGYKKTSLLACPIVLGYYYVLRNMTGSSIQLFLAALLGGMGVTMYWMGMNPEVARSSHRDRDDQEAGIFFTIPRLSSVIAPAIGATVIAFSGFELLFSITIGTIIFSFLPLALTPEHRDGMNLSFKNFISEYDWNDFLIFMTTGSTWLGQIVIWPLYLATIISSAGIGGSGALLALGGAITSFTAGILSDKIGRKKVLAFGAVTAAATFLAMSSVTSTLMALIVSTANGFFLKFVNIPVYGTVMEHSEESDLIEYHVMREIGLNTGRIMALGLLILAFLTFNSNLAFTTGFVSIALLALSAIPVGWKMIDA
jgi:MFS family permease